MSARTLALVSIIFSCTLLQGKAAALSLDEAIVIALNAYQAPLMDLERRQLEKTREKSGRFKYALRPNININHDGTKWVAQRYGLDASVDMGNAGTLYAGVSRQHLSISGENSDQQNIAYVLPLFRRPNSDDINNPQVIDAQLERLERRLIQTQQELVLRIAETYNQAVILEQQAQLVAADLSQKLKRYAIANNSDSEQVKALTISELELEDARFKSESVQIEAVQAKASLGALLKKSLDGDRLELTAPMPVPQDIDFLILTALESRLDYADTLERLARTREAMLLNRRFPLPEMSLRLGYSANQYDGGADNSRKYERFDMGVSGVNLIPQSDRNLQYQFDLERARIERSVLEQQIRGDVVAAYSSLQRNNRHYALATRRTEHYEKQLLGFEKLYQLGRVAYSKVEDAKAELYETQMAEVEARQERVLSEYRLKAAMGTLVEAPSYLLPAKANDDRFGNE